MTGPMLPRSVESNVERYLKDKLGSPRWPTATRRPPADSATATLTGAVRVLSDTTTASTSGAGARRHAEGLHNRRSAPAQDRGEVRAPRGIVGDDSKSHHYSDRAASDPFDRARRIVYVTGSLMSNFAHQTAGSLGRRPASPGVRRP